MDDLISRRAAIAYAISGRVRTLPSSEDGENWIRTEDVRQSLLTMPSAEPGWIPVKTRPMTEEERWYWEEHTGVELEAEDAVFFDCQMPYDGQEVWVCSKCGNVWQDTCEVDEGIGLEENGDWYDIVAWMPYERPKPWKGEADAKV